MQLGMTEEFILKLKKKGMTPRLDVDMVTKAKLMTCLIGILKRVGQ